MQHDHALRASRKLAAKLALFAGCQPAEEAPPSAYSCPALEEGMLIGITQPSVAGLTSEEAMRHDQLFLFWKHARVQYARQGTIGASWLELFARFQALGGQLQCQLVQNSQHVSFKTMLDNFMLKSKAMFAQQGSDDVAELLKPCRTPGARLLQYGVPCHLPSTGIVLCLNLEAAELMHRQLLTLRARSKKGNARQRIGCKFRFPGNPPWQHMKFPSLLPDLASANHAKWTEGKDLRFHERALPHRRG